MFTFFIVRLVIFLFVVLFLTNVTLPMILPKQFTYFWMFRSKKKGKPEPTSMKSIKKEYDEILQKTKEVKSASVKEKEKAEKIIKEAEEVGEKADSFLKDKK